MRFITRCRERAAGCCRRDIFVRQDCLGTDPTTSLRGPPPPSEQSHPRLAAASRPRGRGRDKDEDVALNARSPEFCVNYDRLGRARARTEESEEGAHLLLQRHLRMYFLFLLVDGVSRHRKNRARRQMWRRRVLHCFVLSGRGSSFALPSSSVRRVERRPRKHRASIQKQHVEAPKSPLQLP